MLEHKCEVCGKMYRKKLMANKMVVCNKHYKQFKKFGEFKDNSSRTQRDKNNITTYDDVAYIDLYDKQYNIIAKAIIDECDINKIKFIKWRLNHNGYVVNNSDTSIFLHRLVLGTNEFVDHINGNRLDNRKLNLRIVTKSQNQMNVNYKGCYFVKNSWIAKIKLHGKQLHIGSFSYEEEAKYARWYAERLLFGEFAFNREEPNISVARKKEIKELVNRKVQRL